MSEKSIKVTIGGRIYPISVKQEEEERVRAAAERVDANIKHLLDNYAVKDKQDLLAMTALQLATTVLEYESKPAGGTNPADFDKIESLIDAML
jgi:cell division protein ZapA